VGWGLLISGQYKALVALTLTALVAASFSPVLAWNDTDFDRRPLFAYPLGGEHEDLIGNLANYQVKKGDTLFDVARWYGLTAREVSDANHHIDLWQPPAGETINLPGEHIVPAGPRTGIVLNIPEMRIYYYPVGGPAAHGSKGGLKPAHYVKGPASAHPVVYTFPVGLGRYDWKTPDGRFTVTSKVRDPTWVVPQDIYDEHLAAGDPVPHVIQGGEPDNPMGFYKLGLSLPLYAIHGTDVPWGVGMEVSHGCVRLYPEDIERLFRMVKVGTPGRFTYQPVKFGWRSDALYVEVHEDLYARYPGLWAYAMRRVKALGLGSSVDFDKLEKAVEERSGVPTYVMPGAGPGSAG
jgi:L,D-transpeptidase ErfK/SrfK